MYKNKFPTKKEKKNVWVVVMLCMQGHKRFSGKLWIMAKSNSIFRCIMRYTLNALNFTVLCDAWAF